MSDPVARLLQGEPAAPTPEQDPVAALLRTQTQSSTRPRVKVEPPKKLTYEDLDNMFGDAAIQGMLGLPRSLANLVGASKVRNYLDDVIARFEPELRGEHPNLEAGLVTAGHVIGTFGTGIGQYKIALGGAKVIGAGISKIAPNLTAKALARISRAGAATEAVIPKLGGSALLAKQAGQAVRQLPPQLAAGLGQQIIADPETAASAQGIGLSLLFGFTGALGAGVSLARSPLQTTKPVTVPDDVAPASNTQPTAQVPKEVRDYGTGDILRATPEQIRTLAKHAAVEEGQVLLDAFGTQGARVYKRATKAVRSSTVSPDIAAKSLDVIERMKSKLPEDLLKKVEEVEARGYTAARLRNVAEEVNDYTPEMLEKIDSEILMRQFGEVLSEKNPDRNVAGMYRLVRIYEELTKRGVQPDEMFSSGVKYLEAKGMGKDAAPALVRRMVSTKKALEELTAGMDTPPTVAQTVKPEAPLVGENPIPGMLGEQRTAVPPNAPEGPIAPHSQRILDKIEVGYEKIESKWWRPDEGLLAALARRVAPMEKVERSIEKATGVKLSAIDRPSAATQLLAGWAGKTERMLKFGPFRYINDQVVDTGAPGFASILGPVRNKLNQFRTLAVARRTIEVNQQQKIDTGIDLGDAIQEARNADPTVLKAVEQTNQYLDGVLKYAEDRQLVDPVSAEGFRFLGRAFIPLDRVFSGKWPKETQYAALRTPDLFRAMVGSKLKIIDPVYSVVDYTRRVVRAAELNEVGATLVRLSESFPEQTKGWVEKVADASADNSPEIVVDAKTLVAMAKRFGTDLNLNEAKEIAAVLSDRNLLVQGDIMRVRRNGKVEQYRIDPGLGNVLRSLGPSELALWVRLLGLPAQTLKVGITQNPIFGAFQAFVGMFQTKIQSRYGFRFFIDPWVGLSHRLRQTKEYQEALAAGGTSAFLSAVARSTEAAVRDIIPKGGVEKVAQGLTHPIEVLRKLSEPLEEMNRLGEYIRARRKGAKLFDAALAMRESDTDFSMIGTQMAGAAHIVAFLNPFIQGLSKVGRTAFEKPTAALTGGVLGITAPSVYFWLAAKNDQEVRDLQRSEQGQRNWITRLPGGEIAKIPKPYVYGAVFGNTAEAVLDQMETENPEQYARMAQGIIDQTSFLIMPNALQLWTGLRNNTDVLNNGQPIVSESLARLDPELQYNDNTTDLAKIVGEHLGISPVKFDFAVRNLLGTLGTEATRAIGAVVPNGESSPPAPVSADLPLIGRFLARYPSQGVEPIRTFYKNATEASQKLASLQRFAQQQKIDKVQGYLDENAEEVGLASMYAQTRIELSSSREVLEQLRDTPDLVMSPKKKRELADEIVRSMIETTRAVNNAVREAKKSQKPN